jgi:hypothetical protein
MIINSIQRNKKGQWRVCAGAIAEKENEKRNWNQKDWLNFCKNSIYNSFT